MGTITATVSPMGGGRLIRVDLATGAIDPHNCDTPSRVGAYAQGIGGSPAVHRDRVHISSVPGSVHCLHKSEREPDLDDKPEHRESSGQPTDGQSQCGLLDESGRGG